MPDARTAGVNPLKRLIHQTLLSAGWDLRRVGNFREPNLADFLHCQAIDLVLDVGANEGQFAIDLREAGFAGEIVSFEPISFVFAKLAANAARDHRWTVRRQALADHVGGAKIEVTARTVSSSMKPQAALRRNSQDPDTAVISTEAIEVTTLDHIFPEFAGRKVFLKMDTQGFLEQQILMGAASAVAGGDRRAARAPGRALLRAGLAAHRRDRFHGARRLRHRASAPGALHPRHGFGG